MTPSSPPPPHTHTHTTGTDANCLLASISLVHRSISLGLILTGCQEAWAGLQRSKMGRIGHGPSFKIRRTFGRRTRSLIIYIYIYIYTHYSAPFDDEASLGRKVSNRADVVDLLHRVTASMGDVLPWMTNVPRSGVGSPPGQIRPASDSSTPAGRSAATVGAPGPDTVVGSSSHARESE